MRWARDTLELEYAIWLVMMIGVFSVGADRGPDGYGARVSSDDDPQSNVTKPMADLVVIGCISKCY